MNGFASEIKNMLGRVMLAVVVSVMLTGCMSENQRRLEKSVDEYAATLPQNENGGVVISGAEYSSSDNLVTLTCDIDNPVVAGGMVAGRDAIREAYIVYLKSQMKSDPFIPCLIDAEATLRCVFMHDGKEITQFEILSTELK